MPTKNFGPSTSGYLDPTNRGWETVVFEAGKPVLDKELNLQQDIDGGQAEADLLRAMPSGWLCDDFTSSSSPTSAIFVSKSGSSASVTAFGAGVATISGLSGMVAGDVGNYLTLTGADSAGNNGTFVISSFISSSSVQVTNASGVAGDANNGALTWSTSFPANTIQIPSRLAHVNGWLLTINNTNVTGSNQLVLSAPPVGAGTVRTDIVVLEVWRMLISASPSTTGKSASGRIWRYGNVKTDASADLTLNYTDDLQDTNVGSETTKRVQIQYRLRVVSGVDIFAHPYGLDDPTVFANSVPPNAAIPDGTVTAFNYSNQDANGDPGLWRAGDGNPANTLGTVDGYMYAIPLMALFRRNSTAFDRMTNQNGGAIAPGPSTRPDGLLSDIVNVRDVADLRLGVSPNGWQYQEVAERNTTYLLDNSLQTEWQSLASYGAGQGHTLLICDQVGVSSANGGLAPNNGDNAGGALIGQFDATRRRFSDRPIYEVMTVAVPAPGGAWSAGATFTIDFTTLIIYPYSAFNWAAYAPAAVVAQDIIGAYFVGATAGKKTLNALGHIAKVTNLAAVPIGPLSVTMDSLSGLSLTNETLYVDLLICYPSGSGMSRTATNSYGSSSYSINNPTLLPATSPISYSALTSLAIDNVHREVQLEYQTVSLTVTQAADTTITGASTFRMIERCDTITSIQKNGVGIVGTFSIDSSGRIVTLNNPADYTSPGDTLTVTYTAIRPLPQNNEQLSIWYEGRAPQTGRDALIGTSLTIIPRYISPHVYTITQGSGSEDTGYPFPTAYVQTGGIYPSSVGTYSGEHELNSRSTISISDFNASTGFLRLPTFVPFMPDPEAVTFTRASPGDTDFENRTFFKSVPTGYVPNAYAQDFSDPTKHKVVLPILGEITTGNSYAHTGQLVLVLLVRWAVFDETNAVYFDSDLTQSTTSASVFRIKGNLMNKRND